MSDFPVEEIEATSYDNPQVFIAVSALIVIGILVVAFVVFQFRHEIVKLFRRAKL